MNIFLSLDENIDNKLHLFNTNNIDSIYFLSSNNKLNTTFYNKINKSNIIHTGFFYKNIDINDTSNENFYKLLNNIYINQEINYTKQDINNTNKYITQNIKTNTNKNNNIIDTKKNTKKKNINSNILYKTSQNNLIESYVKQDNITEYFSDKFIKIYNINYNKYNITNKNTLNKLINTNKNTILLIKNHLNLNNINYSDIINKYIKQYFEKNRKNIIDKLLLNLETFYILSIIFNNNNSNIYILHYNNIILNYLKKYF